MSLRPRLLRERVLVGLHVRLGLGWHHVQHRVPRGVLDTVLRSWHVQEGRDVSVCDVNHRGLLARQVVRPVRSSLQLPIVRRAVPRNSGRGLRRPRGVLQRDLLQVRRWVLRRFMSEHGV